MIDEMKECWAGKKIMLIGASSGMGECMAKYFNDLGASIFLVGRNEERLQDVCSSLKGENDYAVTDLAQIENVKDIFEVSSRLQYKFDGLIFTAGVDYAIPIKVNNPERAQMMMNINANSFLEILKYATKKKNCTEQLSIVAISSIVTTVLNPGSAVYAASKAALETIVKVAAKELLTRKIRVNCISPALTDTPMIAERKKSGGVYGENGVQLQKLGYIEPIQVAYLTDFLLSDKAKYMTGTVVEMSAAWGYN